MCAFTLDFLLNSSQPVEDDSSRTTLHIIYRRLQKRNRDCRWHSKSVQTVQDLCHDCCVSFDEVEKCRTIRLTRSGEATMQPHYILVILVLAAVVSDDRALAAATFKVHHDFARVTSTDID